MLSADSSLDRAPQRILVAGVTGVGKSALARRLASQFGIPYSELDALHHGPQWSVLPDFEERVAEMAAGPRWITELQYQSVRELLTAAADTVIWLDYPRRTARTRLLRRTLRRRWRNEVLWNGNVEPPLHTFFTDPDVNILRWEMRTYKSYRESVPALAENKPHLQIVRLRSQGELETWLAGALTEVIELHEGA